MANPLQRNEIPSEGKYQFTFVWKINENPKKCGILGEKVTQSHVHLVATVFYGHR